MKKLVFLLLVVSGFAFSQVVGPRISANEESYDFGKVQEGKMVTHQFQINNTGDDVLVIKKVKASCGCTAAKPAENDLKPGESTLISVTFNTSRRFGPQKKYIYIFTNDPNNEQFRLSFTAEVIGNDKKLEIKNGPKLYLLKKQHNFGKVKQGEIVKTTFEFTNAGASPLKISQLKASCGCTTTKLAKDILQPGEKAAFEVEFDTTDRIGKMSRTVTLYSNDPTNAVQSVRLYINIVEGKS